MSNKVKIDRILYHSCSETLYKESIYNNHVDVGNHALMLYYAVINMANQTDTHVIKEYDYHKLKYV